MSHSFLSYRAGRRTLQLAIVATALVSIGLALIFLVSQTVYGSGGAGGSGDPTGGTGGARTKYGFGWYNFTVDSGTKPGSMRSGSWDSVNTTCRNAGATSIDAFIIFTPTRTVNTSVVYNFNNLNNPPGTSPLPGIGWWGYLGGNGSPWMPNSTAKAQYDQLGSYGVDTSGLTWGLNVAWFCFNFKPKNFAISTTSAVDIKTAKPGDTLTWTHTVKNDGPGATNVDVPFKYINNADLGSGSGGNWTLAQPAASGAGSTKYSTHVVTQDDVGKRLCRSTSASPKSNTDSGAAVSAEACADVPYRYSLKPSVAITSQVVEPGSQIVIQPSVDNSGPIKSQSINWQITRITVLPGKTVPVASSASNQIPVDYYNTFTGVNATPAVLDSGGTNVSPASGTVFPVGISMFTQRSATATDEIPGTKICYALSVNPRSSNPGAVPWYHSTPTCVVVGSRPKVQVLGGDLFSGKSVSTSTSVKEFGGTKYTFGSWIEYGIFAVRSITGAGSGAAYAGSGLANADNCNSSLLSFTNSGSSNCSSTTVIGNYSNASSMPDVAATFPTAGAPTLQPGDLNIQSKQGVFTSGDINLTGGSINQGRWLVLNAPNATVTISGDINYTSATLHSISDIPQMVIIAKQINIESSVTNIDAWLVANGGSGIIDTCSDGGTNLSVGVCNQQLVVNGPVMADSLLLRRTAGSGTGASSGDPAEIFNLRPDAYLWAYQRSASNNRAQTVYSTQLPPRL